MNKLSALYTAMKHMKESKEMNGKVSVEITFGETVVASAKCEAFCEEGKCSKKAEVHYGEELMKVERSGKSHEGCCEGPHHFHSRQFAHGHGMQYRHEGGCLGHGGMGKGKLGKAMFLLKVLDQVQFEELENGTKSLSLEMTMADCPEGIREHMEGHLARRKAHFKAVMACVAEGGHCDGMKEGHHAQAVQWLKTCGLFDVDSDSITPEKIQLTMLLDQGGKPTDMTAQLTVFTKLTTGDSKALRFNMNGKMI